MIGSAYAAATGAKDAAYPAAIGGRTEALRLAAYEPEFRAEWPLSAFEYDDLVRQEERTQSVGFVPRCTWHGRPTPAPDSAAQPDAVTFTRPVFASDRRLAIVEVEFRVGLFGHGVMCVARRSGHQWSALCVDSWIS